MPKDNPKDKPKDKQKIKNKIYKFNYFDKFYNLSSINYILY